MPQSALFGQPPATENDYWIVKALLYSMGSDADPANGIPKAQVPRSNFDNRSGPIVAGAALAIFFVVTITAARVIARKTMNSTSLGWDDTLIVVAAVRLLNCLRRWRDEPYTDVFRSLRSSTFRSRTLWYHTEELVSICIT